MESFRFSFILLSSLFILLFSSSYIYCQENTERQLYENDELFQQLSGAKQTLLENKFGKKEGLISGEVIRSNQGREAPHAESSQTPLNSMNAADILINNNNGATGTAYFTQSETSILAFGNNIVAGFNDAGSYALGGNKFTGFSYSSNGGLGFTDGGELPTNSGGDAGDPVLARNETTGRIYFSTLGFNVSTIQVFRSDDNGVTWSAPVIGTPGGISEDKQWMTVDNFPGTGNGYVYLMSRRFGGTQGLYMFRSTDNGSTFGPTNGVQIASAASGNVQGAFVVVGPDHSVYAFYLDDVNDQLKVRKSTDLGVTFGAVVTLVSGLTGPDVNNGLGLVGIRQGTATPASFRSNSFPHVAVNPVSGHLYVTFNDNPAGGDKGDIYMVMSTDGGATWSAPVRVNDDATVTDQWQPTIAVTPDGTKLGIFYYSRQEDPATNNLFKYYGRIGSISGSTVTFSPSFAISDVASFPEFGRDAVVNSLYMGDYNHASATNDAFYVVWSDNRDDLAGGAPRKDPNVYYEEIPVTQGQFLVWEGVLGGQDYSGAFINSFLTGLAYTVDYTTVFPSSLLGYEAVFLSFGNFPANVVFDATMASAVETYLQAGGRVYLEGGDAIEFDQSINVALHNLFGLGDGSDGSTNTIDGLQGQVGSVGDGMLFTASTQVGNNWIDIYLPTTGTTAFVESGYGNVAVQNSGPYGQKTFCFSYALAYLTDGSFPSTKNELMTRILNYLLGPPELPPDISVTPSSLTFDVPEGSNDSGILTINNLGEQGLVWNIFEQEATADGIRLRLEDGKELPVRVKPKYFWNQPVKGEDYVPYPPSVERPPSEISFKPHYGYEFTENPMLATTDAFGNHIDVTIGSFMQFDLSVPEVLNPVSTMLDYVWAGDFGSDISFAYAVNSITNEFIRIDKATGAITVVGPCGPPASGGIFTGMAVDPTTSTIYLSSTDVSTSWLYTVDPTTGVPTLVGELTNAPAMIAIAINNSGQMYGYDIVGDVMLSVNKSTGAGTVLGALGFDANFGQGMDFDPVTGILYLAAFNNNTFQGELRTGDIYTGNTTLVGALGSTTPGGTVQVGWVGLPGESFDCPWLAENPISGAVPGGGSLNVDIFVDATGLTVGTYNCDLIVSSNDPDNPVVIVPVTLNVITAPPDINVLPPSLTFVVPEGGEDTDVLTIENTAPGGSDNLIWNMFEQELTLIASDGTTIPVKISNTENITRMVTEKEVVKVTPPQQREQIVQPMALEDIVGTTSYPINEIPQNKFIPSDRLASTLLIETTTTSIGQALTELGVAFDLITTTDFTTIDFTPYNTIIIGMDGGSISVASVQAVANEASSGKKLIMYGGTSLTDYYDGVMTYLLQHNNVQGWTISSTPHLTVTNPAHPLANGLPPTYDYVDPSAAYYCLRITDPAADVAAQNGDGFPALISKPIGSGMLIYSISSPYSFYYTNPGDFNTLKTIINNAINYSADVPWISENPVNGTIPAGSSQNVDVTVNATGLAEGNYNCNLLITSNDPDENPVIVPVTLIVTNTPPPENFALVTNIYDNNLHLINTENNTILGPFLSGSLGSGDVLDIVITPNGQTALISDFGESTVFFVDITNPYSPSVYGSVNIGFFAEDIALTEDGAFALVTDGGVTTKIAVIDVGAISLIQTMDITPRYAQAVSIAPNGTVLIADYFNNQVHVLTIDLSTGLLTDPATAITVGPGPLNVAVGPDGQTALVANILSTSVDVLQITGPGSVTLTGTVPNVFGAQSIAFEKSGNRVFVLELGISPDQLAVLSVTSPGNVVDLGNRVPLPSDFSGGFYGVDVVDVSLDGNWAYVGQGGGGYIPDVFVVDLNSYTLSANLPAGNFPTGIAVKGAGGGPPTGDFVASFQVYDNCANTQNLIFGTAPDATDCFDPAYDCYGPPPPPPGAFGGWFQSCSENLFCDFRETNLNDVRIWDVYYQAATGCNPVSFSWNPAELPPDGNFHLVDPFTGELVNVNMRTTNTYTDVIGLGHLQIVFNYEVGVDYNMAAGWNMISLPLVVPDDNYLTLFPTAIPGTLYGFNGSYFSTTTVNTCTGYWLRFSAPEVVTVMGIELTGCTIDLLAGWNMIGGPNCSVPVGSIGDPGSIIIPGTLYGFNGSYFSATSVDASEGYWIRANAPGQITIDCGTALAKGGNEITLEGVYEDFTRIDISDGSDNEQALYFNGKLDKEVSIESFSLPPVAPEGSFDVRLAGDYRLSESEEVSIKLQASKYPVSVTLTSLKVDKGYSYVLKEMIDNEEVQEHKVADGGEIQITNNKVSMLVLSKQQSLPTTFELAQNYPNPFNPSTVIKYALPETRSVELVIYNALGEKVATLVSEIQEAGYYTITWNATNDSGSKVGSGMYIYALKAGDYHSVKKMMLVK